MNGALAPMVMEIVGGRWDGLCVTVQGEPRPRYYFDAFILDVAASCGCKLLAGHDADEPLRTELIHREVLFAPLVENWNKIKEVNHER